jgi:L-alanine-DL-glutamate epimerase-like enolase superfamily enzyme
MKIIKVEAIPFQLPFDPTLHLRFAYRTSKSADHVLVRIYTDEGVIGISEAPARPEIYGETQGSILSMVDKYLGPYIVGKDPFFLEEIHSQLDHIPYNFCAKSAVDIALHDLIGKWMKIPIYKLLGGKTQEVVSLSWMVGLNPKDQMVQECERFMKMGIQAFKIKAGLNFDDDLKTFVAIRKTLGEKVLLYVDANQGYRFFKKAVRFINTLSEHGLVWIEEPFPVGLKKERREASKRLLVPFVGDESCITPADVAQEITLGAVDIVMVKVARTGFFRTRKIISLCQQAGIPCLIGSQGDSSIGAAASLHTAVAFPNILFPAEVSYHMRMEGDLLMKPLEFKDGSWVVPDGPGLGVDIDEKALKKYRI